MLAKPGDRHSDRAIATVWQSDDAHAKDSSEQRATTCKCRQTRHRQLAHIHPRSAHLSPLLPRPWPHPSCRPATADSVASHGRPPDGRAAGLCPPWDGRNTTPAVLSFLRAGICVGDMAMGSTGLGAARMGPLLWALLCSPWLVPSAASYVPCTRAGYSTEYYAVCLHAMPPPAHASYLWQQPTYRRQLLGNAPVSPDLNRISPHSGLLGLPLSNGQAQGAAQQSLPSCASVSVAQQAGPPWPSQSWAVLAVLAVLPVLPVLAGQALAGPGWPGTRYMVKHTTYCSAQHAGPRADMHGCSPPPRTCQENVAVR